MLLIQESVRCKNLTGEQRNKDNNYIFVGNFNMNIMLFYEVGESLSGLIIHSVTEIAFCNE